MTENLFFIMAIALVVITPFAIAIIATQTQNQQSGRISRNCGFDRTKLESLYGGPGYNTPCSNGGPIVSYIDVRDNDIHKQYAINNLGVTEEEIQEYSGADQDAREKKIADLIREEVAVQWSELSEEEKKGCTQLDAERGILTYALGELDGLSHFEAVGGRLRPICEACGGISTLQPLSITNDKYNKCYNRQVGAMWDIKYAIYLGVTEHINNWKGIPNNGDCADMWGQERRKTSVTDWSWPNKTGYPYYGGRYERAVQKAEQYAPSEMVCAGPSNSAVPSGFWEIALDAGEGLDVPPEIIAAIYLTEHHITSFPGDINPDADQPGCEVSSAGAIGPFQIMPDEINEAIKWSNQNNWRVKINNLQDACNYRKGAWLSAFVIKGKMQFKNQPYCSSGSLGKGTVVSKGFRDKLTTDEAHLIGCRYCGCDTCTGCGNSNFNYGAFTAQRHDEILAGTNR